MLQAISRDPAMMIWLDSNSNVKGKPNENYARELMELFSLGVGHYTEKDVREAARAFTGWRTDGVGFTFDAGLHDDGLKTFLGQDRRLGWRRRRAHCARAAGGGPLPGPQALSLSSSAKKPIRPTRCSSRCASRFARVTTTSRGWCGRCCRRVISTRITPSGQRIKGPVEFVLGAVQAVYRRYGEENPEYRSLPQRAARALAGRDGSAPFRAAQRQGMAGRSVVVEYVDGAGAR